MPYKSREVVAKLQRAGFYIERQNGTSHCILRNSDARQVTVSMHSGDIPEGTFKSILKQAGLNLEEFRKL